MQIFVKTFNGVTAVDIESDASVKDLISIVSRTERIPESCFRLTFANKELKSEKMLFDYSIEKGTTVYLASKKASNTINHHSYESAPQGSMTQSFSNETQKR